MADNMLTRFLTWLRAGYPEGVPPTDYIPLFEILERRLSGEEVEVVAQALREEGLIDATEEQIRDMIAQVALTHAAELDVRRVAAHVDAGGWPLSSVDDDMARDA